MTRFPIRLHGLDDITKFVNTLNSFSCNMDLVSGIRIVDAKSMMGVIAISQADGLYLAVYENSELAIQNLSAAIKHYISKKPPRHLSYNA